MSILQGYGGHPPPVMRRQYADCNQRMLRNLDNFPNLAALQYLRSLHTT